MTVSELTNRIVRNTTLLLVAFAEISFVYADDVERKIENGLVFNSFMVEKDYRTGLNLTPDKPFSLSDGFTLTFDLKIRQEVDVFGYILRIIGNGTTNIDLISNFTYNNMVLVMGDKTLLDFKTKELDVNPIGTWIKAELKVDADNNKLEFAVNGLRKSADYNVDDLNKFNIYFGVNNTIDFAVTDVAPLVVKNVKIFDSKNRLFRYWKLDKHGEGVVFDECKNAKATVTNGIWEINNHADLVSNEDAFWVEHNGLTIHLRLSGDVNPAEQDVEFVISERVFAPKLQYLGYIRIKGIIFEHGASGFPVPQRGLVSTNRGNHWIIEDCVIRHANSVGLDIGRESWNSDSPIPVGHTIVRRTHVADAGICGIAGVSAVNSLIESCLVENIGWQNVEQSWESAGIKIHFANNNVVANCLIRDIIYASGIWLDADCNNSRLTNNLIVNVKQTKRGGIYLEASHFVDMIDHNIIWNITSAEPRNIEDGGGNGILVDGSDEGVFAHNLIGMCDNAAIKTRTSEGRIAAGCGGITRWNHVENNLFYRCARAIDFSHKDNFADGNLYGRTSAGG
ncbi:hypothetical protein FACS189423_07730 [Bacteroidia bacterium]|nr:hypothetical protein FACS189423_07730 [Bacteroidia bacterium]